VLHGYGLVWITMVINGSVQLINCYQNNGSVHKFEMIQLILIWFGSVTGYFCPSLVLEVRGRQERIRRILLFTQLDLLIPKVNDQNTHV
jgi:hypothetical protein